MTNKGLYKGKPIEEYTKEELEDIVVELGLLYTRSLEEAKDDRQGMVQNRFN